MQPGSAMPSGVHVVLVTVPVADDGEQAVGRLFADTLVQEGLAACVNRVPLTSSTYMWEGKLCRDSEELLIIKAASRNLMALEKRVLELHPYDLPEFIALEVEHGLPEYLAWVRGTKTDVPGGE